MAAVKGEGGADSLCYMDTQPTGNTVRVHLLNSDMHCFQSTSTLAGVSWALMLGASAGGVKTETGRTGLS